MRPGRATRLIVFVAILAVAGGYVAVGSLYWGWHWLVLGAVIWAVVVIVPWLVRLVGDRDLKSQIRPPF